MYMEASIFIWVVTIYIYMESGVLLLIKSIYIYILFQRSTHDIAITDIPKLLFRIPAPSGFFCLVADCYVLDLDSQWYNGIVSETRQRWCPVSSLDHEFYGLQSLFGFWIITKSHANQCIAVFLHQRFGAVLSGLQRQTCFHLFTRVQKFSPTIRNF